MPRRSARALRTGVPRLAVGLAPVAAGRGATAADALASGALAPAGGAGGGEAVLAVDVAADVCEVDVGVAGCTGGVRTVGVCTVVGGGGTGEDTVGRGNGGGSGSVTVGVVTGGGSSASARSDAPASTARTTASATTACFISS